MSLSMHGETLFHFTDELSTLLSILESSYFEASFARESLNYQTPMNGSASIPDLWVPMVSFCDYKLLEIGHHVLNYGAYGLGMSKKWGINNGLNPVLYVSEKSPIGSNLKQLLNTVAAAKVKTEDCANCQGALGSADIELSNMYAWTKNYDGPLTRKGISTPGFRFADDKEWRYVAGIDYTLAHGISKLFREGYSYLPIPQISCNCCGKLAQSCDVEGARILKARQSEYKRLIVENTSKLYFGGSDIKFILVQSAADRDVVLCWIMTQTGWGSRQKLLLASKLIALDELDFRDLVPALSPAKVA